MTIWDRLPIPTVRGPHAVYPLPPGNGHHPRPTPPAPPGDAPTQPTTPPPPRRRRLRDGRGWAYIGMLAGLAASIAANVAHAFVPPTHTPPDWHPPVGAIVSAVVWPAFLFAALEILVRTTWQAGWRWRLLRFAGLLPVAGMAALVSYLHMRALLRFYGEDRLVAAFGPVAVDGLMVMATAALMATSPQRRPDEVKHRKPAPGDPPAHVPQPVEQPRHAEPEPTPEPTPEPEVAPDSDPDSPRTPDREEPADPPPAAPDEDPTVPVSLPSDQAVFDLLDRHSRDHPGGWQPPIALVRQVAGGGADRAKRLRKAYIRQLDVKPLTPGTDGGSDAPGPRPETPNRTASSG